jgi:hypothetical protein
MTSSRVQPPQDVPQHLPALREQSQPAKPSSHGWLWFALILILSAAYMAHELKRGWIPADDGVLAESAERVLHGALPHRDYHELYTGLLSYVNAAAFRAFGTNLASMRYVLFMFFLAWVPALYYGASKFVSAPVASALTLLAVAWGPPNCGTPMPSWYNLFFATFGLAAMLRYVEVQSRRWLVIAGICGGISFLFKMTGLYFVAGVLLFLAFREQMTRNIKSAHRNEIVVYRVFLVLSVISYEALLLALLRKQANVATYVCFWLPNLAIGAAIIWCEFYVNGNRNRRFSFLFRELVPFGAGIALPIAVFLMPYVLTGSLSAFMTDLLVQPGQMLTSGSIAPHVQWFLVGSVVNLLLIGAALLTRSGTAPKLWEEVLLGVPTALLVPSFLLLVHQMPGFFQMAWSAIWAFAPFVLVLGIGLLVRWSVLNRLDVVQRQGLFLTLAVTATCSLIQFPFTIPIYFCYVAPLVVLSAAAIVSLMDHPPRLAVGGMMCFCFLFAVFELTPGFNSTLGVKYGPDIQTERLPLPRVGDLLVAASTVREYTELDSLIRQHARSDYILAAPNCPQVYFLSGRSSPTRDFLDFSSDFGSSPEDLMRTLQGHGVHVVVLNHLNTMFVRPVPNDLRAAFEREFPNHAETEWFEVRWKP